MKYTNFVRSVVPTTLHGGYEHINDSLVFTRRSIKDSRSYLRIRKCGTNMFVAFEHNGIRLKTHVYKIVKRIKHIVMYFCKEHPSLYCVLRLTLDFNGEAIVHADPHIFLLHRWTKTRVRHANYELFYGS